MSLLSFIHGRPDQVHNCTVTNISMTSFSVKCSEGFNGGLPQSFYLEVRESESQELKSNLSSPVPRFSVTRLQTGVQYQISLFSYNSKGRSEPVILQAFTLRLPEKQLTAEKDTQLASFRFTPMMSVLIGVVSALLIVALVVIVVLRVQCSQDDRMKRHKNIAPGVVALEHRGSVCGPTLGDKGGGSPISKHESSCGEYESDEKNPDIIPQPVDEDSNNDYMRKRQHISTIETSPSRNLLHHASNSTTPVTGGYIGYCTLRNGMPLHELTTQSHPTSMVGPYPQYTLPRPSQQSQWQYGPVGHLPPGIYPIPYQANLPSHQRQRPVHREPPIPLQPILQPPEEESSVETPLMINKRESTV